MAEIIKLNKPKEDFDHYINELSSLCKNDLNLINATILNRLDSNIPLIHEIASYLINSGGKRLRPLLTSCSYQLCKNKTDTSAQHIWLAAAVEFIHTATLLHDDVVDESKKRRGLLTANEV